MATKKIEIQDSNGNVYYPHTDASVVKNGSKTVAEQLNEITNHGFLINKDFKIWQRGTSFADIIVGQYTADRWQVDSNAAHTIQIDKVDTGLKMTWNNTGLGMITQLLELIDKERLIGKKVSFAVSINGIIYTYTTTISTAYTYIDFDLSTKTFTTSEHPTVTMYYIYLHHDSAPIGTTYIINYIDDNIGGNIGDFTPRPYAEELALCQRYYEFYPYIGASGIIKSCVNATCIDGLKFEVEKRTTPTITLYNETGEANKLTVCSGGTGSINVIDISGAGTKGFRQINSNDFNVGNLYSFGYIADAEIY